MPNRQLLLTTFIKLFKFQTMLVLYAVHSSAAVVMSVVDKYHLIPTPVFSSFKPLSVQKRREF